MEGLHSGGARHELARCGPGALSALGSEALVSTPRKTNASEQSAPGAERGPMLVTPDLQFADCAERLRSERLTHLVRALGNERG